MSGAEQPTSAPGGGVLGWEDAALSTQILLIGNAVLLVMMFPELAVGWILNVTLAVLFAGLLCKVCGREVQLEDVALERFVSRESAAACWNETYALSWVVSTIALVPTLFLSWNGAFLYGAFRKPIWDQLDPYCAMANAKSQEAWGMVPRYVEKKKE
eukprot:g5698.t1